jgi:hypothetical protein
MSSSRLNGVTQHGSFRHVEDTLSGICALARCLLHLSRSPAGRELMAAPWWVWGAFAAACLGLLGLLQLMRRNIGA